MLYTRTKYMLAYMRIDRIYLFLTYNMRRKTIKKVVFDLQIVKQVYFSTNEVINQEDFNRTTLFLAYTEK